MVTILLLLLCMATFSACAQTGEVKTYTYKVEEVLDHDITSYTQGLFFHKGQLYESAGQYGESSFRKVDLKSGKVLKRENFDRRYFIEGSCVVGNRLYILTWQEKTCFVYDIDSWKQVGSFKYFTEGWGLTTDGKQLIMSDGTSRITFRDPETFEVKREITVKLRGQKVMYLNELEYIKGEIWANIYGSDLIARINPETGAVTSVINCTNILLRNLRTSRTDVLNGIAYNPEDGNIYITGKYWPKMYRIKAVEKK